MWAVTLKSFQAGKGRLAPIVDDRRRAELAAAAAERVIAACREAGGELVVVTPSADIAGWCRARRIATVPEPAGGGLDGAATAAAEHAEARNAAFAILHADLPLLDASDLAAVCNSAAPAVIAPSRNGGTSLLAASEPVEFHYGPDSFRRHLDAAKHLAPEIVIRTGLAVDLDTPSDLVAAAGLERGAWLRPYLDERLLG